MTDRTEGTEPEDRVLAAVLPDLLRRAGVEAVTVELTSREPSFRGRSAGSAAQAITTSARANHQKFGFGFWEFALSEGIVADPATRRALIVGALRHHAGDHTRRVVLAIEEFARSLAGDEWADLAARDLANLCSRVRRMDGSSAHLQMLDFGIANTTDTAAATAKETLLALGLEGVLLASSRSFHFIGSSLVEDSDLTSFLARAQLLSPIIDSRWTSHAMIDGQCRLRISTDVARDKVAHRLVGWIGERRPPCDPFPETFPI